MQGELEYCAEKERKRLILIEKLLAEGSDTSKDTEQKKRIIAGNEQEEADVDFEEIVNPSWKGFIFICGHAEYAGYTEVNLRYMMPTSSF